MEWVEVRGRTIEVAVQAAMEELGVEDRERVDVEVLQEPERGFLGLGGKDAVVKVKLRPSRSGRRRRRRRGGGRDRDRQQNRDQPQPKGRAAAGERGRGKPGEDRRQERDGRRDRPQEERRDGARKPGRNGRRREGGDRKDGGKAQRRGAAEGSGGGGSDKGHRPAEETKVVTIDEQIPVVEEFLSGLVGAFGLDGEVEVGRDEDVILADITGSQTEAMVGTQGAVIEAVHELTKTVLQRQTQASARLRLDIAGYGRRRRQALAIYAHQLIDQVLEEGGEIMMEPMSAGDRKVIHDAVAEREGVRSYSEGEEPGRFVVIAATGDANGAVSGSQVDDEAE